MERYYTGRFAEHGATARGVDWNSEASQELRFDRLLEVCRGAEGPFTLNDYGCGYGALVPYLGALGLDVRYRGFDLSQEMLEPARREHGDPPRVTFVDSEDERGGADFTGASGVLNVKLDASDDGWRDYALQTIDRLAAHSTRGFAFNMLTSYSDEDKMRPDLYYGDPTFFFDHCKRRHSRDVALLHDYGLYEFTMIVRIGE